MRTSRSVIIGIVATVCLIIGCTDGRYDTLLSQIDTLIENHPDSALLRLDSLRSRKDGWSKRLRMRFDLLEAKAQNKAFIPFASDSIAKDFTAYYDSYGTANERMLAHYLLGCAYRDLGEAPHAVDCYLDAISQADTTAQDCDYYTLSAVYAQMACVYYDQLLLSNSIETYKKASHFAFLAKKYDFAILDLERIANNYILMNKKDSAELVLIDVQKLYAQYGYTKESLLSSTKLIYLYIEIPEKLNDAKRLMEKYESEPDFFNDNNELIASKRQFYYYKGRYHEAVNQLDSAEYYYRKVYRTNMSYVDMDPMYRGLLSVFTKRHQADSIAKYAQLYCLANDSSIAKKDRDLTAQMAASYNYNRYQKESLENEKIAHHTQLLLISVLISAFILAIVIYAKWKNTKKKQEQLRAEYTNATDEYHKNIHTLQILESAHKEVIAKIQEELKKATTESQDYKSNITEINAQYEYAKKELIQENEILKNKIEELKRQEGIRQEIIKTQQFTETDIVKRVLFLSEHPLTSMTEKEWEQLLSVFTDYYPTLIHDLNKSPKITQQEIRTCLLICLSLRESDIARLLNTSAQRVTNMKSSLNYELFSNHSARSLYRNLTKHYDIYTL